MRAIRNNMKKIAILLTTLLLLSPAFADSGVGIKYAFEHSDAIQEDVTCLTYGVYNPFDTAITATMVAEGDFAEYQYRQKDLDLDAYTYSNNSKDLDVCFKVPKMVEDCDSPVKLTGNVVATPIRDTEIQGSGAVAKVGVSAPLELNVICGTPIGMTILNSIEPNIFLGVGIGGLIALIIFIIWFLIKRKKKKVEPTSNQRDEYMSKYSDLMVLHKKISADIASQEEVEKYKSLRSELEDLRNKL